MKLRLLAFSLLLSSTILAQSPRLSLYEEFTGEMCPPCALQHPAVDNLLASATNSVKVVMIKWMLPIAAAPTPTWSLYKTNKTEIDWRYRPTGTGYGYPTQFTSTAVVSSGINIAPMGLIDGQHQWNFGAASDHVASTDNTVIANAQANTSPFSVTMAKAWNQTLSALNITVNIVASQNFTASGTLVFRTVMIEKVVQFSAAPGSSGETTFYNPVIASFPSIQAGTSMAASWTTGQTQTFTLTCPLPSYARDVNQVDLVGFIQDDGDKKVQQAVRAADCTVQTVSVTSDRMVICAGDAVTLNAGGAATYSWSTGETGGSIIVSPSVAANYWVMSTDANACGNTAALAVSVTACTSIYETTGLVAVNVYPNPNKGSFLVKTTGSEKMKIVIIDALGRIVFEQNLTAKETLVKTNLSKGLYTYQIIQSASRLSNGKLVIE